MKRFVTACLLITVVWLTGCAGGTFKTVEPPLKEFPEAAEYTETEAFYDDLVISRNLKGGYKNGNTLVVNSRSASFPDFKQGDEGIVTYSVTVNNSEKTYTVAGALTSCPEGGSGIFVVTHEELPNVKDNYPGTFSVIERTIEHCLLLPRRAVTILNDEGDALVYFINETGTLSDKSVRVGATDGDYYEILSGISAGEKVVLL